MQSLKVMEFNMKRIFVLCIGYILLQISLFAQEYSSYEILEQLKNNYGENKWFFEQKTDRWGETIQGEGSYIQIVEGLYSDFNGSKKCLCMFQSSKSFLRGETAYMGCFVFFKYFSPVINYDNSMMERFNMYAKKHGDNQTELNTEAILAATNSISSFGVVIKDLQYSVHQAISKDPDLEIYNSIICMSEEEYLEILIEGNNWELRTKLYGDSPMWK